MKYKTAKQWYSSPEHFRSERSWEEYSSRARNRKPRKKSTNMFGNFRL